MSESKENTTLGKIEFLTLLNHLSNKQEPFTDVFITKETKSQLIKDKINNDDFKENLDKLSKIKVNSFELKVNIVEQESDERISRIIDGVELNPHYFILLKNKNGN